MAGVFQVDREIFDNNIWQNPAEFRLFFYILGNAVWSEEGIKYRDILVKRGQYLRSYRNLRMDLMYMDNNTVKYYGIATIKRNIDKLVKDGRLEKEETELGTLFTVVNYNKYQGFERFDIDNLEQQRNTCGTPAEHQRNNKKKDKKDNKDNNDIKNIPLQIKNLRDRYDTTELKMIDSYFDILKWTRKNGKIADSVILKIYQEWEKFPKAKVLYALNIYVSNPKYHDKRENYCYGIMRNATSSEITTGNKGGESDGKYGNRINFSVPKDKGKTKTTEELEREIEQLGLI